MSQKHTKREKTPSDICESERSQGRTRHAQTTKLHGPSQSSPEPIPDMRSSPRARIALIGQPLLPKLLQGVEARHKNKR